MKFHFITSIIFAVFLGMLAITEDNLSRMFYLVPVLIFFYATIVLYSVEYDAQGNQMWKKKERKLVEETYLKFFKDRQRSRKQEI
jgi:archaellum biogenesis protein FlaJ (TadC family)